MAWGLIRVRNSSDEGVEESGLGVFRGLRWEDSLRGSLRSLRWEVVVGRSSGLERDGSIGVVGVRDGETRHVSGRGLLVPMPPGSRSRVRIEGSAVKVRNQSNLLRHHLQDIVPGGSQERFDDRHHLLVSFPNLSDVLKFARFPEGALVLTTVRVQSLVQLSKMAGASLLKSTASLSLLSALRFLMALRLGVEEDVG